jgi:hypothetical protein
MASRTFHHRARNDTDRHHPARPHVVEQLVLAHDVPVPLDEVDQNVQHLRFHQPRESADDEFTACEAQRARAKPVCLFLHRRLVPGRVLRAA